MSQDPELPTRCLADVERSTSVRLNGVAISLQELRSETQMDMSYLSRILSGDRIDNVPISTAKRIAHSLGMTLDGFLDAVYLRRDELNAALISKNFDLG